MFTRLLKLSALSCGMAVSAAASATPLLIDFSEYASTGVHAVVTSGGFDFAPAGGTIAVAFNGTSCSPNCAANGTTALAVGGTNLNPPSVAPITLSTALYTSFRLTGLDYAELSNNYVAGWSASSITLVGSLLGGGTVSQTLQLDGVNDGQGGVADFETASLGSFWASSDLVSLSFAGFIGASANHAFQLDNIALDVSRGGDVPEPGSLALAGLALVAVWGSRKAGKAHAAV